MIQRLRTWYDLLVFHVFNRLQCPLLFILRAYIGWQFYVAGKGKLADIGRFVGFLTNLGIPMPQANAYFVASLECFGGLLLLVGLASRLIAVPLAINMLVAYITADHDAFVNVLKDPDAFTAATPFLFLLVCLLVITFGPGWLSLDTIVRRVVDRKWPKEK